MPVKLTCGAIASCRSNFAWSLPPPLFGRCAATLLLNRCNTLASYSTSEGVLLNARRMQSSNLDVMLFLGEEPCMDCFCSALPANSLTWEPFWRDGQLVWVFHVHLAIVFVSPVSGACRGPSAEGFYSDRKSHGFFIDRFPGACFLRFWSVYRGQVPARPYLLIILINGPHTSM